MKPFKFNDVKPKVYPYHQPKPAFKPRYNTKPSKVRFIIKNFKLNVEQGSTLEGGGAHVSHLNLGRFI